MKGLIKTALRDENPVIFIEHKGLYNSKGPVPEEEYLIPFGQACVARQGTDVTLVALGMMVKRALEAAEILAQQGISAEVIDPRTLVPFDKETIFASLRKTGRLAIVDEAYSSCGMAACEALDELDAPILRICTLPAPHTFSPAIDSYLVPSVERIAQEVSAMMGISL